MPTNVNAAATSFAVPNFRGMLFAKGNAKTPFSTLIGARPKYTDHVEFACGQYYDVETGAQPAISENASLTAPTPVSVVRDQLTNVTQIFQATVAVSYGKMSNMGTMSGINAAGQQPNPNDELSFQVARRMAKIAADVEYTFLNGAFQKATGDGVANKSRGLLTAITTNVMPMKDAPLTYWNVAEAMKLIHDQGGDTSNLVLGVDATTMLQLNYDSSKNGMTVAPGERNINGLAIDTVLTALGKVGIVLLNDLPAGTAVIFDPSILAPVFMNVPGKGNFFLEELAKTGAGTSYMLFGQAGLDHGPEWLSAKIIGISTDLPSELGN